MGPIIDYIAELVGRGETTEPVMRAKRRLIEEFGILGGFAVYRNRMAHLPDRGRLHLKPLIGLQEVARQCGAAYHQTTNPQAFVVPTPRLLGEGERRPLHGRSRSMFVACLIDAQVRARSGVIELGEVAAFDREGQEWTRFDDQLDLDASIFTVTADGAWIIAPPPNGASLELDEAFTLLGIRPYVFGHWLCEHLARLVAGALTGALPSVPILVEAGLPASHYQALRLMLPAGAEIIELPAYASARVRRLWCAPNQALFPVFEVLNERFRWDDVALPPAVYGPIAREMERRVRTAGPGALAAERLFLGRRPGLAHALVNMAAIEAAVRRAGFHIVYPEDYEFIEQARLLGGARFVIGQAGSALHLVSFAAAGTRLCILACVDDILATQSEFNAIFDAIGIATTIISGPAAESHADQPWRSDFVIDEQVFSRFLTEWLAP